MTVTTYFDMLHHAKKRCILSIRYFPKGYGMFDFLNRTLCLKIKHEYKMIFYDQF